MASPPAPPFLIKTYAMVDDPATDDTISWNESGTAFVVWRRAEFERDLLPKNFKHSNFASFVRQLNTYVRASLCLLSCYLDCQIQITKIQCLFAQGFRKVGLDRWEFANDCFRRGEKRLLGAIQRRKGTGVVSMPPAPAMIPTAIPISSTTTSSGGDPAVSSSPPPGPAAGASGAMAELEEENAWLRRENARLTRELARARRVCDGVRHLVSLYDHGGGEEDEEDGRPGGKPMLFGVSIGSKKRSREDGDEEEDEGEENGEEDGDEEQEDDYGRHVARREPAAMSRRTEPSDLDVLALSVRAAAAARPGGGSRDRKK
jgi:heat shock transcription factor